MSFGRPSLALGLRNSCERSWPRCDTRSGKRYRCHSRVSRCIVPHSLRCPTSPSEVVVADEVVARGSRVRPRLLEIFTPKWAQASMRELKEVAGRSQRPSWATASADTWPALFTDQLVIQQAAKDDKWSDLNNTWLCGLFEEGLLVQGPGMTDFVLSLGFGGGSMGLGWPVRRANGVVSLRTDVGVNDLVPLVCFCAERWVAIHVEAVSPMHSAASNMAGHDCAQGIILMEVGGQRPLLQVAAKQCFWQLPAAWLLRLCRYLDLEVPDAHSLTDLLELLIGDILKPNPQEMLSILELRLVEVNHESTLLGLMGTEELKDAGNPGGSAVTVSGARSRVSRGGDTRKSPQASCFSPESRFTVRAQRQVRPSPQVPGAVNPEAWSTQNPESQSPVSCFEGLCLLNLCLRPTRDHTVADPFLGWVSGCLRRPGRQGLRREEGASCRRRRSHAGLGEGAEKHARAAGRIACWARGSPQWNPQDCDHGRPGGCGILWRPTAEGRRHSPAAASGGWPALGRLQQEV